MTLIWLLGLAHSILIRAYHLIRPGTAYVDLASNDFDQRKAEAVHHQAVKPLARLGFTVVLQAQAPAA
jgi:hypothetical protein